MRESNCQSKQIENVFEKLLDDAYEFYVKTNFVADKEGVKKKIFQTEKNTNSECYLSEIFVGEDKGVNKDFRIVLCNQQVKSKHFTDALKGKSSIGNRTQTFERIKDISSQVKEIDMLVMAELALPISELYGFLRQSADQEMAFISGIEFITINRIAYNLIATVLPINLDGTKDTVPILRLKNDYTHSERQLVTGVEGGLYIPKLEKYVYHLYRWRGFSFTTYYCFELANINMRNIFFSKIDFMVVPLWNMDNHYFNAIGEATARDLHCYYVQVNSSEFGETRIIEPVSSIKSDLARVKGGTIDDPLFCVSFLVSDLKIEDLREAQLLSYELSKEKGHNPLGFKPLPPNWPDENVKKRKENKPFFNKVIDPF